MPEAGGPSLVISLSREEGLILRGQLHSWRCPEEAGRGQRAGNPGERGRPNGTQPVLHGAALHVAPHLPRHLDSLPPKAFKCLSETRGLVVLGTQHLFLKRRWCIYCISYNFPAGSGWELHHELLQCLLQGNMQIFTPSGIMETKIDSWQFRQVSPPNELGQDRFCSHISYKNLLAFTAFEILKLLIRDCGSVLVPKQVLRG